MLISFKTIGYILLKYGLSSTYFYTSHKLIWFASIQGLTLTNKTALRHFDNSEKCDILPRSPPCNSSAIEVSFVGVVAHTHAHLSFTDVTSRAFHDTSHWPTRILQTGFHLFGYRFCITHILFICLFNVHYPYYGVSDAQFTIKHIDKKNVVSLKRFLYLILVANCKIVTKMSVVF